MEMKLKAIAYDINMILTIYKYFYKWMRQLFNRAFDDAFGVWGLNVTVAIRMDPRYSRICKSSRVRERSVRC